MPSKRLKVGERVYDQVGDAGWAVVLERIGRGWTGDLYVRVRWDDGEETSEPTWRFGEEMEP